MNTYTAFGGNQVIAAGKIQQVALRAKAWLRAQGNLPAFEEASRALFAHRREDFFGLISAWQEDLRSYIRSYLYTTQ